MWRLDKIMNSRGLKRVKITHIDFLKIGLVHVALNIFFLVVAISTGNDRIAHDHHEEYNQEYLKPRCGLSSTMVSVVFYTCNKIYNLLILLGCIYYLWRIRDVPSSVNEVFPISIGIYTMIKKYSSFS